MRDYLQAGYDEPDVVTGVVERQLTRRWFLSPEMVQKAKSSQLASNASSRQSSTGLANTSPQRTTNLRVRTMTWMPLHSIAHKVDVRPR
jgi:trehalose-6-phosphate synthase